MHFVGARVSTVNNVIQCFWCTHLCMQIHLHLWDDSWNMLYTVHYYWWARVALLYEAQKASYVKKNTEKEIQPGIGCFLFTSSMHQCITHKFLSVISGCIYSDPEASARQIQSRRSTEALLEIRNLCMMTSRRGEKQQMSGPIVKSTLRSRNEKNESAESLWVPAEQRNFSWMPTQVRKTTRTDHTELVSSAWWKQIFSCKQASAATAEAWVTQTSCRGSTEPVP